MPKKVIRAAEVQDNPQREARRQKEVNRRTVKRRNKKLFKELTKAVDGTPIALATGKSMEGMLDDMRNRAYAYWRFAAAQVDALHPDDFWVRSIDANDNIVVEPHRWVQFEAAARQELEDLGIKLIGLGLEERRVRLEEAQFGVVLQYLDAILGQLNLTQAQLDALPGALDAAEPILEGSARSLPQKTDERAKAA
jgi:hypothetical protein